MYSTKEILCTRVGVKKQKKTQTFSAHFQITWKHLRKKMCYINLVE